MAKYEQETKLVQLFADLKGTFKQLEGATDLKKQDSLLQSTSAKLQEAKLCAPDLPLISTESLSRTHTSFLSVSMKDTSLK